MVEHKMTTYSTSIRLPESLKNDISEIAKYYDRKPHWLMLKALETFAEREKTEIQELQERSKLAQIQRENGTLKTADVAIADMRNYVAGLK